MSEGARVEEEIPLDDLHPTGKAFFVAVEVQQGFFGMFPAVIPVTVVEIHQPEAFGLEPQLLDTDSPARHHPVQLNIKSVAFSLERLMLRIGRKGLELCRQFFCSFRSIRGERFHRGQQIARIREREDPALGSGLIHDRIIIGHSMKMRSHALIVPLLVALSPNPAATQTLPSEPVALAGGRVTIGAEASASFSTNADEVGWFNYTDYEHNALRLVRIGVTADIRLGTRVSVLGELRTDNWDDVGPYALYVRVRPWTDREFDIQAGRIPPTFGAFARRNYSGTDNPVIGYPLAYQYLTSLRPDAVPATADDLLGMRGRGWRPSFPVGNTAVSTGLPLVTAFEWDTGVEVRLGSEPLEVSASVTTGTLSKPRVKDDNGGKQIAARLAWRPVVGLILGVSGARGPYLSDSLKNNLPANTEQRNFNQRAWGIDLEYSRDYWLIRGEAVFSDWALPAMSAPVIEDPVQARSVMIEGRYSVGPGIFVGGRYDYLGFSQLQGSRALEPWDAPVTRVEAGGGYYLRRNLIAKVTYQHNWRDDGLTPELGVWAGQLQFWF